MEGGGDHNEPFSAPESSNNIPLLTVPVPARSSYHEYCQLLRPMLTGNIIGHIDYENVTYSEISSVVPNRELQSPLSPPCPPPPPVTASMLLPMAQSVPVPTTIGSMLLPMCTGTAGAGSSVVPPTTGYSERLGGFEKGESSGTKWFDPVEVPHSQSCEASDRHVEREQKRKQDSDDPREQQSGRTRRRHSPHVHNLSERTRRNRITESIRTLQKLIPNCNKTDKASVLNDAIEYIKMLQQQVQMLRMYQSTAVPYYTSFVPMRSMMGMGHGMGMLSPIYGTGFPLVPPSGMSPQGESRFLPVPQLQLPVGSTPRPNQATIPIETTSATASTSATGFPSTYIHGESSTPSVSSYGSEFYNIPRLNQGPRPQGLIPTVQASLITRTQSFSSSLADEIFQADDEVQKFHQDSLERR